MRTTELPAVFNGIQLPADARVQPQGANGLHITFPNGVTVSCIWGPGSYSENRDVLLDQPRDDMTRLIDWWNRPLESQTVEVAFWDTDGAWLIHEYTSNDGDTGEPLSHRTTAELQNILNWAAGWP